MPKKGEVTWTQDLILAAMRDFLRKYHRFPTQADFYGHVDGLPAASTVSNTCPRYEAMLRAEAVNDPTLDVPRRIKTSPFHLWRKR